jgi:hypothetical protein
VKKNFYKKKINFIFKNIDFIFYYLNFKNNLKVISFNKKTNNIITVELLKHLKKNNYLNKLSYSKYFKYLDYSNLILNRKNQTYFDLKINPMGINFNFNNYFYYFSIINLFF